MQQVPATHPVEDASSVPDPLMDQVTVEGFYELLEDVDVYEAFEEFIVPAKPHGKTPC
jgi:hypothetical protein